MSLIYVTTSFSGDHPKV